MICYRDMTFCTFWEKCKKGKECFYALTDEEVKKAHKWWGNKQAPISIFSKKPDCFKKKLDK